MFLKQYSYKIIYLYLKISLRNYETLFFFLYRTFYKNVLYCYINIMLYLRFRPKHEANPNGKAIGNDDYVELGNQRVGSAHLDHVYASRTASVSSQDMTSQNQLSRDHDDSSRCEAISDSPVYENLPNRRY